MMSVWDAETDQSVRSCTAPRLLAMLPPNGSMFSFSMSAQLPRTTRLLVGTPLVIDLPRHL